MWAVRSGLVTPFGDESPGENGGVGQVAATPASQSRRTWLVFALAVILIAAVSLTALWVLPRSPAVELPLPGLQREGQPAEVSRWQAKESLPVARNNPAVAAVEDLIYVISGESPTGITDRVDLYNPGSNSWSEKSPKPLPVMNAKAAVIGGRIFIPGGELSSGEVTDLLEIYDPRLDAWETGVRLPRPLSAYALIAYEGRLYLFGGWDGSEYRSEVYMYLPAAAGEPGRWLEITPMPVARAFAGAAISGGRVYVMGGLDANGQILTRSDVYTPVLEESGENPWSEGMPLPEARARHGMTSVGDLVFVLGGDEKDGRPLSNLQFFPAANLWQRIENPIQSVWTGMGVIGAGTQLYTFGGEINREASALTQTYQAVYSISVPFIP